MQSIITNTGMARSRLTSLFRIQHVSQMRRQPLSSQMPEGANRETSGTVVNKDAAQFDTSQLDKLVCPLSKAKLRWDPASSELICDELNVAYPVVNGVPQLTPDSGRVLSGPVPGADSSEIPAQPS